jgi:hypothetical protein
LEDDVDHVNSGWVCCASGLFGVTLAFQERNQEVGRKRRISGTNRVYVEITSVEYDWPVHVVNVEVLECYVLNVSVPNVWTCPSLQTSAVLN